MIIFGSLFAKTWYVSSPLFSLLSHSSHLLQFFLFFSHVFFHFFSPITLFFFRRIHRIFNSKKLHHVSLKNFDLFVIIGCLVGFELIIQIIWMTVDPPVIAVVNIGKQFFFSVCIFCF
jgi:hypothetical protein